jgi:hypothetical protein
MRNSIKEIYLCLSLVLLSSPCLAGDNSYEEIKSKIDVFENSVIKDFYFSIPADFSESYNAQQTIKLGRELDSAFKEQENIFYAAEDGLFKIETSLKIRVKSGEISSEESDKLLTSVEYARRIILHSRKIEVVQNYHQMRDKLIIKPSISVVYQKILNAKLPGNCKITNPQIDKKNKIIAFNIQGFDKEGNLQNQNFTLSQSDVQQGNLNSRYDNKTNIEQEEKVILSFSTIEKDRSTKRFCLFENSDGEFYHAEFSHENIETPWFSIFGLGIGSESTNKKILCTQQGPKPASIEEIERDSIKQQYFSQK